MSGSTGGRPVCVRNGSLAIFRSRLRGAVVTDEDRISLAWDNLGRGVVGRRTPIEPITGSLQPMQ
jgi:hypothetical protein